MPDSISRPDGLTYLSGSPRPETDTSVALPGTADADAVLNEILFLPPPGQSEPTNRSRRDTTVTANVRNRRADAAARNFVLQRFTGPTSSVANRRA